jgi:uncharacterized DUF497 family protein
LKITWDENKNEVNKTKHGISFETAQFVFDDPLLFSQQDRFVNGEERWQAIGLVGGTSLLVVAHPWIDYENEEHIRIISARLASKTERRRYEDSR